MKTKCSQHKSILQKTDEKLTEDKHNCPSICSNDLNTNTNCLPKAILTYTVRSTDKISLTDEMQSKNRKKD